MIRLTIDGKEISVEDGTTILQAAEQAGILIPHLCYHKKLLFFGACRICIIEVEQMKGRLIPSCSTPVTEGMVIQTIRNRSLRPERPSWNSSSSTILWTAPSVTRQESASSRTLFIEYGVDANRFRDKKFEYAVDYVTPLVERNVNRCVLCGMCARVCDEVVGVGEHSFVNRGFKTKIATDFDRPMDCEFCGQCINICLSAPWGTGS